ncbi:hypothetical protein GQ53DRAFT_811959 [Thozetella sp. PMI_491]|nr:hypothetical protein GQ53DRAFT_811959 [Thozetella sp. PMI_491]
MATSAWPASSPLAIPAPSPLPSSPSIAPKANDPTDTVAELSTSNRNKTAEEIEALEAENAALSRELDIQAAILLSNPSTRSAIASLPPHDPRRKALLAAVDTTSIVLEENAYRMLAGITAFSVRDPDPYALDSGHLLGVRIDVCSNGRFKTPYFIFMLRAWPKRRTWVKLAWHTVPPGVAVEALAERYLPAPKWTEDRLAPGERECCRNQKDGGWMSTATWKPTARRLEAAKRNAARRRVVELKKAAAVRKGAAFRRANASKATAAGKRNPPPKSNIAIKRAAPKTAAPSGRVARENASNRSRAQQTWRGPRSATGEVEEGHVCVRETPQDLPRFLKELRCELVAYNNRLSWVADMMEAAGVESDGTQNRFLPKPSETEDGADDDNSDDSMYCYESDESDAGDADMNLDQGGRRRQKRYPADYDRKRDDIRDDTERDPGEGRSGQSESSASDSHSDDSEASSTQDEMATGLSWDSKSHPPRQGVAQIRIMDPQVKQLRIEWADGRTAELMMDDDGLVTKLVVLDQEGVDRKTARRLLRNRELGKIRIERLVRHLAGLVHPVRQ